MVYRSPGQDPLKVAHLLRLNPLSHPKPEPISYVYKARMRDLVLSMNRLFGAALTLGLVLASPTAWGQFDLPGRARAEKVLVSATPSKALVSPGDQMAIAVVFDIAPNWHIWPEKPDLPPALDLSPIPTLIGVPQAERPAAIDRIGPVQWPPTHDIPVSFGAKPASIPLHEGRVVAYLPLTIRSDAAVGSLTIPVSMSWQACDDTTCLPPRLGNHSGAG